MADPGTLILQMITDLTAFQHNAADMFPGGVHGGIDDVPAKAWSNPPIAIIRTGEEDADIAGDEPELGEFTIEIDVYTKDTRDDFGHASVVGTDDVRAKAALQTIRQKLRDDYAYKAGGVYGCAMMLANVTRPAPAVELDQEIDPGNDEPDVFFITAIYTVLNG